MRPFSTIISTIFLSVVLLTAKAQIPDIIILTNTHPSEGYIFLATWITNSSHINYLLILDKDGNVVFNKSLGINGNYMDFKPQPGNRYSFFSVKQNCYYILDKHFDFIDTVKAGNGYSTDAHELLITDKNQYILMGNEIRTVDMSKLVAGGKTNANVTGIVILELDSNKKVLFEWKSLDHIPITDTKEIDLTATNIDYIHTNSLVLASDTTLIMSNRNLNDLTKINLKTGDIIWRMGKNSTGNQFTFVNDTMGFSYQHYARILPNGNITLFDNGNFRPNGQNFSRVCEYEIDEVNMVATLVWQYRNTPDNICGAMGSVQRLENGNTIIGWGTSFPNVTEVDSLGNKVFEMTFPSTSSIITYRALKYNIPNPVAGIAVNNFPLKDRTVIYPNPSSSKFTISIGYKEDAYITIYDMLGQLILKKNIFFNETIFGLPKGIYNVFVSSHGSCTQQKVVVL